MKKYFLFFKLRFATGLQYRMASVTALTTQLIWGIMECLAYKAIAEAMGTNLPMEYSSIVTYIWLKEAFLALFLTWTGDKDIFALIQSGGVSYELCRPISVYSMWFARIVGGRGSEALLRSVPILICAFLLPGSLRMSLPVSIEAFVLFFVTLVLAVGVAVALCMFVNMLCFFTISPQGWRMVLLGSADFFMGNVIPLPFFPERFRKVVDWLPFPYMQNVPFRVYSGDLPVADLGPVVAKQVLWLVVLVAAGLFTWKQVEKKIVVQGG